MVATAQLHWQDAVGLVSESVGRQPATLTEEERARYRLALALSGEASEEAVRLVMSGSGGERPPAFASPSADPARRGCAPQPPEAERRPDPRAGGPGTAGPRIHGSRVLVEVRILSSCLSGFGNSVFRVIWLFEPGLRRSLSTGDSGIGSVSIKHSDHYMAAGGWSQAPDFRGGSYSVDMSSMTLVISWPWDTNPALTIP